MREGALEGLWLTTGRTIYVSGGLHLNFILTFKLVESSCIRISHLQLAMHFAQSKTGTAGMDTLAKGAGWNFRMESGRQLLRER